MLQHNISRNSVLQNKVHVLLTNKELLYREPGPEANFNPERFSDIFNVKLKKEIKRVNKIRINNLILPNIYNISDDNRSFTLLDGNTQKTYKLLTIPPYVGEPRFDENGDLITDAVFSLTAFDLSYGLDPIIPNTTMLVKNNILFNKIAIQITDVNNIENPIEKNITMTVNNLTYNLGFLKSQEFIQSIISKDPPIYNFIIDDSNNTLIFEVKYLDKLTPDIIEVKIPNATYDIYTLINVLKNKNVYMTYDENTKLIIMSYGDNLIFKLQDSNLKDLLGFESGTIKSEYLIKSDTTVDLDYWYTTIFVDYTKLDFGSFTYNIDVGKYTIEEIIDILNNQNFFDDNGTQVPMLEFSYSKNTNRVKIVDKEFEITGLPLSPRSFNASGLGVLLGLDYKLDYILGSFSSIVGREWQGEYIFPKAPVLDSKYYTVRSNAISLLREEKFINYIDSSLLSEDIIYTTLTPNTDDEIFLSRKSNIKDFDIYITNDRGELISLKQDSFAILMTFYIS